MGRKPKKRSNGSIRKLPSGSYQARVRNPLTGELVSIGTFKLKADADTAISLAVADQRRGAWVDPRRAEISLAAYSTQWLANRTDLRLRTRELYDGHLRLHILPALGGIKLCDLTTTVIRSWHSDLLGAEKPGTTTVAKVYRLLRTILNTAVEDEVIVKNPARIKNAGVERSMERPTATIPQVYSLADAIEPMFRAMVLLATFASLRLGEIRGLRRRHVDLLHGTVTIEAQVQEDAHGNVWFGAPKTEAGLRTLSIPQEIVPDLERHLAEFSAPGRDGLVFPGKDGQPFRRATFYKAWAAATKATGMSEVGLRFHDLRHTGSTLAAVSGATTKELMARVGHSTPDAALRYQHATKERDRAVASLMGETIRAARAEAAAVVVPMHGQTG